MTSGKVPYRYNFPKIPQSAKATADSDLFAQITAISLTFDSKPLLTTLDANALQMLSIGNGFSQDFYDKDYVLGSSRPRRERSLLRHKKV